MSTHSEAIPMQNPLPLWSAFQNINRRRRAIRDFNGVPVAEDDMRSLLAEAVLAPSSGNLQPFQFHWVRTQELKESVAGACNGQRAAMTAPTVIVIAASPRIALATGDQQLATVESSIVFPEKSKAYYRKQARLFRRILGLGSWALWTPLVAFVGLMKPSLSLLPLGSMGSRNWAARNAAFAAQTLMLAAAAKGIDTCPMEGVSAPKIAALLKLPRETVIPLVVALGYRAEDARIEPQWRRLLTDAIVEH